MISPAPRTGFWALLFFGKAILGWEVVSEEYISTPVVPIKRKRGLSLNFVHKMVRWNLSDNLRLANFGVAGIVEACRIWDLNIFEWYRSPKTYLTSKKKLFCSSWHILNARFVSGRLTRCRQTHWSDDITKLWGSKQCKKTIVGKKWLIWCW